MPEVNEEIVEQYLKVVKKWFYISDIPFKVPHNYSNIDLLAFNPLSRKYYDFEVKYRSAFSLTNNGKDIEYLSDQFTKYFSERAKKLSEFIGDRKSTKVIVTTHKMMGTSISKRKQMEKDFSRIMTNYGFLSEVWYFDEMIPQLVDHVEIKGRYNTQLLQTIRMLRAYSAT